jgi:hypothetical protein
VVVGPQRAELLATRFEQIRAKSRELIDKVRTGNGNQAGDVDPPEAVREAVTMDKSSSPLQSSSPRDTPPTPAIRKPATWWSKFIFGKTPIPRDDAVLALQLILGELGISVDEQVLSFQDDVVSPATFASTLEGVTGSDLGWRTLVQIYEREEQRAHH